MTTQATSSAIRTGAQIRQEFIDYFVEKHRHTFAPSSPVVPHDDPTLLFTNAGMNQFKDVFLGRGSRDYTRAVNTQKCIRAGGKHNDLEDVGTDTYHHTFFEMLGNWSFGDYFKAEAIEWAWDLLTNIWGLDKDRLYVTVFEGDASEGLEPDVEAEDIWKQYVDPSRISRWGKKDNFWEMGDTGPCGPCSEIHYDNTPDGTGGSRVNMDDPQVIEIWNLVFIQFNREYTTRGKELLQRSRECESAQDRALMVEEARANRSLIPLPEQHVDTGMGLERVTRVMQGKDSNYDTDLWTPIFKAIESHTGARPYSGDLHDPLDIAYRVIADHVRCLTAAITDGANPSNEGRGYVLRRILRRAVRHSHQTLNTRGAWLHELVPTVVETLGHAFPEMKQQQAKVAEVIRDEEESFLRTLDRGSEYVLSYCMSAFTRAYNQEQYEKQKADGTYKATFAEFSGGPRMMSKDEYEEYLVRLESDGFVPINEGTRIRIYRPGNPREVICEFHPSELTPELVAHWCHITPTLSGPQAFKLHDTYGFPIDLTRIMAEERGMTVDEEGYEKLMEEARQRSRQTGDKGIDFTLPPDAIAKLKHLNIKPTNDERKFTGKPIAARIEAIWNGEDFDDHAHVGSNLAVVLNRTNHYAEQGGQVGDKGDIHEDEQPGSGLTSSVSRAGSRFDVQTTQQFGDYVLHIGRVTEGKLSVGDSVIVEVERKHRDPVMSNHTATHLLNHALRAVLGDDVNQKGSLVAPDRLRFDFSHSHAMKDAQIDKVEQLVSAAIEQDLLVDAKEVSLNIAQSINGVRAVFGERYPDPVRVVSIGATVDELLANPADERCREYSVEFCGGTHLESTAQSKRFIIQREEALASGVRRITALTGTPAIAAHMAGQQLIERAEAAAHLADDALFDEFKEIEQDVDALDLGAVAKHHVKAQLETLRNRIKTIQKQQQSAGREQVVDQVRQLVNWSTGQIIVASIEGGDKDTLMNGLDVIRAKRPDAAAMLFAPDHEESKVAIAAVVPKDLIARGLKAGDWVRQAARACGGGGGGKPDMAQAGGKDTTAVPSAIEEARDFAEKAIE